MSAETRWLWWLKPRRQANRVEPVASPEPGVEVFRCGPRRALRVLRPELGRGQLYEPGPGGERRESINDNFYSRWARRPHPSGNCRCSFRLSLAGAEPQPTQLRSRIEPLEPRLRGQIVRDLDRYIGELLDEILDDTIRALAAGRAAPARDSTEQPPGFDISFAFPGDGEGGAPPGYVNRGFVGEPTDPDALDATDSGINSVETIELQPAEQPELDQRRELEQSLIDIIDAKLGGSSIGKSLENLGIDVDDQEDPPQAEPTADPRPNEEEEAPEQLAEESKQAPPTPARRSGKSGPDDAAESGRQKRDVPSRVSRTMRLIGRRVLPRLGQARRKRQHQHQHQHQQHQPHQQHQGKPSLELEDYRRRFPAPEPRPQVRAASLKKPTLVFLHGFGSSAEAFGPQLEYFAALGYPCLAPDLLGHGLSSAPAGPSHYAFRALLADLELLLDHYAFKPGHSCVIVAHNYGCSFATALASKYSSSVMQLVLISGGGPTPLAPPAREGLAVGCLRASLAPLLFCGMQRAVLYSARGRQHPYCGPDSPMPSHMRHVLRGMAWPEGDYAFHRRIATPSLLVHGLRDNSVSLVQECQMERTMVKAFLEAIPAAGHMPMTDCPEQLNHMIHCFIDLWKNKKW